MSNFKKDPHFFEKETISQELRDYLNELCFRAEMEQNSDTEKEIKTCFQSLKETNTKKKLSEISQKIKKAEDENNKQKIISLIQEFNALCSELNHVQ